MDEGISVLIPAHNEENTIRGTLNGITSQDYENYEVIVIDDCSSDTTPEIVEDFEDVKLIQNKENLGLAGSLNKGMEIAEHDIIGTLHADCVPKDADWLKVMKSCFTEGTAVVACRHVISEEKFEKFNLAQKLLSIGVREKEADIPSQCIEASGFDGKGDLYKKEAMKEIGGFGSERFFRAGEDGHIKIQLMNKGWSFKSAPTFVYHNHGSNQESLKDFFRKKLEYSEAFGANRRIHGSDKPIGLWNEATKTLLYVTLLIPYINIFTALIISLKLGYQTFNHKNKELGYHLLLVPFILLIGDLLSITGFWKGYLTGKQTL
jgi:biofilm PGA synthesis N-glycosyltransferase PgaC